eukprot:m51a1_g2864 hypothetical protein (320) ;mRNA; f:349254-350440
MRTEHLLRGAETTHASPRKTGKRYRRCHTNEGKTLESTEGRFFPNYTFLKDGTLWIERPLPADGTMRDDSALEWLRSVAGKLAALAPGTGILYLALGTPNVEWTNSSAASFFLLEVAGRIYGVSALHAAIFAAPFTLGDIRAYICPSDLSVDHFGTFETAVVDGTPSFVPVTIRADALEARSEYISQLAASRDKADLYRENLDPVEQLRSSTNVDVLLFDRHTRDELKEMYRSTTRVEVLPEPRALLHRNRSVSVGKIKAVGKGIISTVNTLEEMSSGSVLLDQDLNVVGINFGALSDSPDPAPRGVSDSSDCQLAEPK